MAEGKLSPPSEVAPSTPPMIAAPEPSSIRSAMSIDNLIGPADGHLNANDPHLPTTPDHADDNDDIFAPAVDSSPGVASFHDGVKQDHDDESADGSNNFIPLEDREFICVNDDFSTCHTGQVTLNLSRKVISDHFGRNKACTRLITDWPLFCRKHYQRATYKPNLWQRRKVDLIARQLDKIEQQYPGTVYDVTFKKSEESRLNEFARKVAGGVSVDDAARLVAPDPAVRSFQAPVQVLRHLEAYTGKHKSIQVVKEAVATILDMLENKETEQVPSIEFLPVFPANAMPTAPAQSSPKKATPAKASSSQLFATQASATQSSTGDANQTAIDQAIQDDPAIGRAVNDAIKGSPNRSRVSPKKGSIQKLKK